MTPPQHGIFAKANEVEFEGDAMPADSLVSRANEKIDGALRIATAAHM